MTFDLFAYSKADEDYGRDLRRHGIHNCNLEKAVRWALGKGLDTVLIERSQQPATAPEGVVAHGCRDPQCPGGCP